MAEVLDNIKQEAAVSEDNGFPEQKTPQKKRKRFPKKAVIAVLCLLVAGAGIAALVKFLDNKKPEEEILREMVSRGAITSTVEGSGAVVAKNSDSVTILSSGQVMEVFVSEGDFVTAGTPLFLVKSAEAEERVNQEMKTVSNYQKQLSALYASAQDLNVRAEYSGKLQDVEMIHVGDTVSKGMRIATLVDDSRMRLSLYFSYAYENEVYPGQVASISVPAMASQLTGQVEEIHKVEYISPEGGRMFEVVIVFNNPGTLAEGMTASATLMGSKEQLYPYDSGEMQYYRTSDLVAKVSGTVAKVNLFNYAKVSAGDVLLSLRADDNDTEVAGLENGLQSALKSLEEAQKTLDSLNAVAPIDGTVLALGIAPGDEVKPGTVAVSIADTRTMVINASIDEMNIAYVKPGMPVDIDQWGTPAVGEVESVSLSGQYENGVSRFPVTIVVDNSDGTLMSGSYVQYSFVASQNDDCLLVPIQCVKYVETEAGTQKALFVESEERPENALDLMTEMPDIPEGFWPVAVETGISDSYNVEIISGVEEGTSVFMSKVMTEMW
ncbi:MAG: HlyD family efflux transporter periplasmic adaptor subunit [Oscillospiraceae bacterium]|nr:HlyD family efflux transporter periplasmic adaptor subunit [Oscillospiraceae bacterium]